MAKKVAAVGPVEGPWELPDGWRWERLPQAAAICDHLRRPINNTQRLKRNEGKSPGELYPYYGATGQVGVIDGYLADGEYILLGEDGAPFLDPFRTKAYAVSGRFWVNNHAHVLMGKPHLDARLLLHWLNTIKYEPFVNGTTRLKLTQGAMKEMAVPVPPADIQSRLVSRIDKLFGEIDDGEAALARARGDLATWRKALLKAAVTGELTADWRAANPTSETGTDLLASILAKRRERWQAEPRNKRKTYTEPIGPEAAHLPPLPGSWTWLSIQQLATVVRGASPRPAGDPRYFGGDIPWITVGSLTRSNAKHLTSVDLFVTPLGREHSRFVEAGTLLFTNSGATLGVPKITSIGGCINDGSVALLELDDPLKSYVYYFLRTQTERLRALNQGAAQPNLNTTIVKEIAIPVPPLDEMIELIATLERLLVEVEAGEDGLQHLRTAPATLRQSILAAAFRGELA